MDQHIKNIVKEAFLNPSEMCNTTLYRNGNHDCLTWRGWTNRRYYVMIIMRPDGRRFQYDDQDFDSHIKTHNWAVNQASKGLLA